MRTDRGTLRAPLVVDALGWRRVLASPHYQPPEAPLSRGLEVHPHARGDGDALDVWVERSLVRRGYGWRVPAGDEARIGVGSYEPRDHVKEPTVALAGRLDAEPERFQGNWFPHRLRRAVEDGVFCVGDSAGHCFPLSGEGIRTALYFGVACGRELDAVLAGRQDRDDGPAPLRGVPRRPRRAPSAAPCACSASSRRCRPRALDALLRALAPQPLVDRAFGWYLNQAHPAYAA